MTQKKEITPMEAKAVTETIPVKPETASVTQETESASKPAKTGRGVTGDLSPELVELVTELRETVRRMILASTQRRPCAACCSTSMTFLKTSTHSTPRAKASVAVNHPGQRPPFRLTDQ